RPDDLRRGAAGGRRVDRAACPARLSSRRRGQLRAADPQPKAVGAPLALLEEYVMARLKLDLRPVLRLIASRIQDENQDRLLSEQGVNNEELDPRKEREAALDPGRKRVRILGVR